MGKRLLSLLLLFPLLAGCGDDAGSATSSSHEGHSGEPEVISHPASQEESYYWNEEIDDLLLESVEDYGYAIPKVSAERYDAQNAYNKNYGITFTSITCYGGDVKEGYEKTYAAALRLMGWTLQLDEKTSYYQGYGRVDYDVVMYITFGYGEYADEGYFAIAAWIQHDKLDYWPEEEILDYIGIALPDPGLPYYELTTLDYFGIENLTVLCYPGPDATIGHEDALAYRELLEDYGGFVFDDTQAPYYAFYAEDEAQTVGISWAYQEEYEIMMIMIMPLNN